MDYEKKYKEAIERAKQWRNAPNVDKIPTFANRVIEEIFPELKESEDDTIRKELIEYHKAQAFLYGKPNNKHVKFVAWLEKQGEQKPKKCMYFNADYTDEERKVLCDGCEEECELRQKPTWSEEDKIHYNKCLSYLESISPRKEDIEWFKSLKDRVQPKQEWYLQQSD